jgi:putative hydrolase of the HAD superfamily
MKTTPNKINLENIRCLLIDLDDTLYPQGSGAWDLVGDRIDQFLITEMGFPPGDVTALRARLWRQYGTTLRGLQVEHEVDMDHYLRYVHDVPFEDFLTPDPDLAQMLRKLPQRKVIFTNASAEHAQRVTTLLGVQDHFEQIIDVYTIHPHCKPEVEAFHTALGIINEIPQNCLLVDDTPANLETAKSLGMTTVSIGRRRHDGSPHIPHIKALSNLF